MSFTSWQPVGKMSLAGLQNGVFRQQVVNNNMSFVAGNKQVSWLGERSRLLSQGPKSPGLKRSLVLQGGGVYQRRASRQLRYCILRITLRNRCAFCSPGLHGELPAVDLLPALIACVPRPRVIGQNK